jgi:hypothetical protein
MVVRPPDARRELPPLLRPPGRGLHPSTFQLNLMLFWHKIQRKQPLISPDTPLTTPGQPLNASPTPQKALTLIRKVDEYKPPPQGVAHRKLLQQDVLLPGALYTRPMFR